MRGYGIEFSLMEEKDVIDLYSLLERNNIKVWIDGGWGIDALLSKQTRTHDDLDIAIQWKDAQKLRELLVNKGYKQVKEDSQWNFVLADDGGRKVDVHAFVFDSKGNVVEGIMYPAKSLAGTGSIGGKTVNCIAAEYVIEFHGNYELEGKHLQDIRALCDKFNLEPPENYKKHMS